MSNLSAIEFVTSPSALTTGLLNQRYSVISANFAALNSDVTQVVGSGTTLSILTNLETSGGAHFQFISVGSTPPSYVTTAAITVEVSSAFSDYLYLVDSSGQKSSYVIGSRAGNLADGLNIWDASAGTMIASFSKQSIRFFQNLVGPVFDTGGALTGTYNAATFGIGSQSTESRIQAAINQASIDGVPRVYVPANMYPYSGSSVSFIDTIQMVREGGDQSVFDVLAYGASGLSITRDESGIQAALNAALVHGGGQVSVPPGAYSIYSTLTVGTSVQLVGIAPSYFQSTQTGSLLQSRNGIMAGLPMISIASSNFAQVRDLRIIVLGNNNAFNTITAIADVGVASSFAVIDNCNFQFFGGKSVISLHGGVNRITRCRGNNQLNSFIILSGSDNFVLNNESGAMTQPGTGSALSISGGDNTVIGNHFYNHHIGIGLIGNSAQGNRLVGNRCEKNDRHGIFVDAGFDNVIANNHCWNNGYNTSAGAGIALEDQAFRNLVTGNLCQNVASAASGSAQTFGVYINNLSDRNVIIGNSIYSCTGDGIRIIQNCKNNVVRGNHIDSTQNYGILVTNGCHNTTLDGNDIIFAGQATDNTYDAINLNNSIVSCTVSNNVIRTGDGAIQNRFGIKINDSSVTGTVVANNDLRKGGKNQPLSDTGQNSLIQFNVIGVGLSTFSFPLYAPPGSALIPSFAISSETSLGFYRSAVSAVGLSYGALQLPNGSNTTPSLAYSSTSSLGFYSSGVQTVAQSLGTFNLATNAVRFSMRTLAASSVTASAAKTNVAVDEVVFTIGGASGASLIIYSGGTAYGFNSAFSAAAS